MANCLSAWKKSELGTKGVRLVLAGGNGWKSNISELIEQLQIRDSVTDCSPGEQELRRLYAQCYAVALPSIYEGFGLPLVEGMAFGKPLITSNVSSMPEIAGDAALLVDPTNDDQIADALSQLAFDKGLYEKLSQTSAQRATEFSWVRASARTYQIIKQTHLAKDRS